MRPSSLVQIGEKLQLSRVNGLYGKYLILFKPKHLTSSFKAPYIKIYTFYDTTRWRFEYFV